MKLRLYLAGASAEHERVSRMADVLHESGLVALPDPWWVGADQWTGRDSEHCVETQRSIAFAHMWTIMTCHVFWLLWPRQPSHGAMFELGIAARLSPAVRTIVTGPGCSSSIYTALADVRDESCAVGLFEVMRAVAERQRLLSAGPFQGAL